MFCPPILRCCLTLLIGAAFAAKLPAQAGVPVPASMEGVLLLRNGGVLQGAVRREGDVYQVELAHGLIEVPDFRVAGFFRSLIEAYFNQRDARGSANINNCLELARWCLKNGLLEQAAAELQAAQAIDSQHAGVLQFDRELRIATENVKRKAESPTVGTPRHFHKPSQPRAITPARQEAPEQPPVQRVPQEARADFLRSIQPMLISSCTTTGCHTSQSQQKFQLNRFATRGGGNPQLAALNLDAVLALTEKDSLEVSPLLQFALQEHGARDAAEIARYGSTQLNSDQFAILRTWCYQALEVPLPELQEAVEDAASATAASAMGDNEAPSETNVDAAVRQTSHQQGAVQRETPLHGARRDEFDPAIFNSRMVERRAHGRASQ